MARRVISPFHARLLPLPLIALLIFLGVPYVVAEPSGPWETLKGCRFLESKSNDGDSFHVSYRGKEFIFRLYYVDCPETPAHRELTSRTTSQAKYFGIKKTDLFAISEEAAAFTADVLSRPFSIYTCWEDARGNSKLPRYFGIVTSSQGDLAQLLVGRGYARIYGYAVNPPGEPTGKAFKATLKADELRAKAEKRGAWAFSRPSRDPAR